MWTMQNGTKPWPNLDAHEAAKKHASGARLPELTAYGVGIVFPDDRLTDIMRACWQHDPSERPQMATVQEWLTERLRDSGVEDTVPGAALAAAQGVGLSVEGIGIGANCGASVAGTGLPSPRNRRRSNWSGGRAAARFRAADLNNDGSLSRAEFKRAGLGDDAAFAAADVDNDGVLSVEELRVTSLGEAEADKDDDDGSGEPARRRSSYSYAQFIPAHMKELTCVGRNGSERQFDPTCVIGSSADTRLSRIQLRG